MGIAKIAQVTARSVFLDESVGMQTGIIECDVRR